MLQIVLLVILRFGLLFALLDAILPIEVRASMATQAVQIYVVRPRRPELCAVQRMCLASSSLGAGLVSVSISRWTRLRTKTTTEESDRGLAG